MLRRNTLVSLTLVLLTTSCATVSERYGATTVATTNSGEWKQQREEVVEEHKKQVNAERSSQIRSNENKTDWGEVAVGVLSATNTALQQQNQRLAQQNASKAAELRRLQYINAQNAAKKERSSEPQLSKVEKLPPQQIPVTSTEPQTTQKPMKIVLGTPTYQVGAKDKAQTPSNEQSNQCSTYSQVDGEFCRVEKIALCKENQAGFWFCYGHNQYTNSGEKGDAGLRDNLRYSGCKSPRKRINLKDSLYLFYCDAPWKQGGWEGQPVSAMESQFSVTIPETLKQHRKIYRCKNYNDNKCELVK